MRGPEPLIGYASFVLELTTQDSNFLHVLPAETNRSPALAALCMFLILKPVRLRHKAQMEFQENEYFKEKSKERYKIEAKNSELKHRHGYDTASSSGLIGMEMQGALAIFTVNVKRILKLLG